LYDVDNYVACCIQPVDAIHSHMDTAREAVEAGLALEGEPADVEEGLTRHEERAELLAKLRAKNITSVIARYSGSGDSGDFDEVTFLKGEVAMTLTHEWRLLVLQPFENYLDAAYGGWENEDGGSGEFVWTMADDLVVHTHHTNVFTQETEVTEL
jgi:hypothetical protein